MLLYGSGIGFSSLKFVGRYGNTSILRLRLPKFPTTPKSPPQIKYNAHDIQQLWNPTDSVSSLLLAFIYSYHLPQSIPSHPHPHLPTPHPASITLVFSAARLVLRIYVWLSCSCIVIPIVNCRTHFDRKSRCEYPSRRTADADKA